MRSVWALVSFFLVAAAPAQAAVIGGPLLRDGLEIVPSLVTGIGLERVPATMTGAMEVVFLIADVQGSKDEPHGFTGFIPYLSISYILTKDDVPTFKKAGLLYPVAAKDGPHYAAATGLSGAGTYHLTYIVSPPSSHGMIRRTDKAGGVPDWWKPITANWTFTYPQNKN